MKKTLLQILAGLALTLSCPNLFAQSDRLVSTASELEPFYRFTSLPAYREGTYMEQASSYDRTGWNDDGFSGRYSFVRRRPDSSLVLFDAAGPGVINRIWTPTPSGDTLDFYIDDTTRPAFSISYLDLFSGKAAPFTAPLCNNQLGGYYCYLPIPFQQRCLIVFRGKHTQFYQIGYRSFPAATRVKSFRLPLDAEEDAALQKIAALWNQEEKRVPDFLEGADAGALQTVRTAVSLRPGESKTLLQLAKGGRIVGIELDPATALEGLYKDVDIRITWDGEARPAVYAPVADFFGYAFGKVSMESLLIGSARGKNYCYFPMPFDRSARIELVYRKRAVGNAGTPLRLNARVYHLPRPRNAAREGKFYAHWNHHDFVSPGQPHIMLERRGKGHYVGTTLQTRGLEPGMTGFFEGDDSTVVDGKLRMHGTGSEDYFNGGWYAMMDRWDGPLSLPLHGALDYNLPLSRTGGYRLFLTDKIPFFQNIHHSIEHGPEHNAAPGTYTSVAYYYSSTPPAQAAAPANETTVVTLPDTLTVYPQLLTFNTSGDLLVQRRWRYPTGGEAAIFTYPGGEAGLRVQLTEVPDGTYGVYLDYARFPQGGSFSLWQRQTPLTDWMDAQASDTVRVERQYLSDVTLTPLNHTITLRFRAGGDRNQFFLNRIILIRKREDARDEP